MSETDIWIVLGVSLAAGFGFLSFLNTLGMHLAVRHLKKRVLKVIDRIDGIMDNPVDAFAPQIVKFIEKMNDDEKLRVSIGGGLTFATKTMMAAATGSDAPKLDKDGKPIPQAPKPKGIIGQLMAGAQLLEQLGFIKLPGGSK